MFGLRSHNLCLDSFFSRIHSCDGHIKKQHYRIIRKSSYKVEEKHIVILFQIGEIFFETTGHTVKVKVYQFD